MKRIHSFEFCDQAWLPQSVRQAGTEFLATVIRLTKIYQPTGAVLRELLAKLPEKRIIVLGAGSGGGIMDVLEELPSGTEVILTDLFPEPHFKSTNPRLSYYANSVDAVNVPPDLRGARVMYTSFHHLRPEIARQVLANCVKAKEPVAIFESTERSFQGLAAALLVPFIVLGVTPWVRPFRWSRLGWTYVIPLIPALALWDGVISSLRTYNPTELKNLVSEFSDYDWDIRMLKGPHQEPITSLKGTPK